MDHIEFAAYFVAVVACVLALVGVGGWVLIRRQDRARWLAAQGRSRIED